MSITKHRRCYFFSSQLNPKPACARARRHVDGTLPKYMLRTLGCDARFGVLYTINPALIVFLVPLLSAVGVQFGFSVFTQILVGSFISSAAVFLMVAPPHYASFSAFMVLLSVGEAIYSPRLFEYTATVARPGQEGLYMSLSSAPMFASKFLVGAMSGWLLSAYCPCVRSACEPCCAPSPQGAPHPCEKGYLMWLIIGNRTVSGFFCLFQVA